MNAAALLLPVGGSVFRTMKKAVNALDGASKAARAVNRADHVADARKPLRRRTTEVTKFSSGTFPGGIPEFFSQGPVRVKEILMAWPTS